jgi:hypothetical protein
MALLPKRLVWAKTIHHGGQDTLSGLETSGAADDPGAESDHELATEIGNC